MLTPYIMLSPTDPLSSNRDRQDPRGHKGPQIFSQLTLSTPQSAALKNQLQADGASTVHVTLLHWVEWPHLSHL